MKKLHHFIILLFYVNTALLANSSNTPIYSYAIGIFNEKGYGENIQHSKKTKNDYNGICYSKVVLFTRHIKDIPKVNIGNSKGHIINRKAIYNKEKIKIGEELTYKHFNVKSGYIEVRVANKLLDSKVFIK